MKYKDLDFAIKTYLELYNVAVASNCETDKISDQDTETADHRRNLKRKWRTKFNHHFRNKPTIFAGKSDLKSAFRILGLSRSSWKWLVMKAQDPVTSHWKYFVDKCLPFGSSISCSHFQRFSDALCHLIEHHLQVNRCTTNYLDDFLVIALTLA